MIGSACLLTEAEVAERLKCSVSKVRKLRYAGTVAYLPGRPVMIMESDFLTLEREEQERADVRRAERKKRRRSGKQLDPAPVPVTRPGFSATARGRLTVLQRQSFANAKARRQREQ